MKNSLAILFASAFFCLANSPLAAQTLALEEVVNLTTTSSGSAVFDGLDDAFDGYASVSGFQGLDFQREINTFQQIFSYRVFDSFTNNTANSISTTIDYSTNLGSDGDEFIVTEGPFQSITFQDRLTPFGSPIDEFDPVIAFTTGNNQFAFDFAFADVSTNDFSLQYDITVKPGETVSLLQFATLIKDATDRTADVDIAAALSNSLIASPFLDGLSDTQINSVANFDAVPEPASAVILLPLVLLSFGRRR